MALGTELRSRKGHAIKSHKEERGLGDTAGGVAVPTLQSTMGTNRTSIKRDLSKVILFLSS